MTEEAVQVAMDGRTAKHKMVKYSQHTHQWLTKILNEVLNYVILFTPCCIVYLSFQNVHFKVLIHLFFFFVLNYLN